MSRLVFFICLVFLVFCLTETNPTRSEYVNWLNERALNESSNFLEKGVISLVGETYFDATTSRRDFYLFSIYTTDFSGIGKEKMQSLGIFNQFIPLSQSK
ncbi:DUF4359 domain-containing protein [Pseudoneobacillus sp. C159]